MYVSKIEDIKAVSGPIVQRYLDKVEEERQAILKAQEEEAARKRAAADARKKAEEEAEAAKKKAEGKDEEMTDAPSDAKGQAPSEVEEA